MSASSTSRCSLYGHDTIAGVRANLSADIQRYLTKSPANIALGDNLKTRLSAFLTPELICVLIYRISHYLYINGWLRLAVVNSRFNSFLHRVTITPQSCIGPGCRVPHPSNVTFHGRAGIGLTLYSLAICCPSKPSLDVPAAVGPTLGDRVTVGGHAVVIGPVAVGDDVKVAFSVRVDRDVPSGSLVVSQAQRVKMRFPSEVAGATTAAAVNGTI